MSRAYARGSTHPYSDDIAEAEKAERKRRAAAVPFLRPLAGGLVGAGMLFALGVLMTSENDGLAHEDAGPTSPGGDGTAGATPSRGLPPPDRLAAPSPSGPAPGAPERGAGSLPDLPAGDEPSPGKSSSADVPDRSHTGGETLDGRPNGDTAGGDGKEPSQSAPGEDRPEPQGGGRASDPGAANPAPGGPTQGGGAPRDDVTQAETAGGARADDGASASADEAPKGRDDEAAGSPDDTSGSGRAAGGSADTPTDERDQASPAGDETPGRTGGRSPREEGPAGAVAGGGRSDPQPPAEPGPAPASRRQGESPARARSPDTPSDTGRPGSEPVELASLDPTGVPTPAPRPPAPPAIRFDRDGPYLVQVAALANRDMTCTVWEEMEARWPELFLKAEKSVLRAELADGRVVYRMRAGAFASPADAARFCRRLKEDGGACFVTVR